MKIIYRSLLPCLFFGALINFSSCKKDDPCKAASTANAGPDQSLNGATTTLAAETPQSGTGSWSIVSGSGGTIAEISNPASSFTGVAGQTYELKWTVSGCPSSEDNVKITFTCTDLANAGPDQSITSGTTATLAATGTGTWTIVSGSGGNFANATSATSVFTGTSNTNYVLRWTLTCSNTKDDVFISFNDGNPQLITIDKTSGLNGEIIVINGVNFSSNFQGGSQINLKKSADPLKDQEIFLTILSRTAFEIKAVLVGVNGGSAGAYAVRYLKKPDANPSTVLPSNLTVTVNTAGASQFFTSSTYSAVNVAKGNEGSFGIKNGSLSAADYTVKLVGYNYTTGVATEYVAAVTGITSNGFGGTMDKIAFTVPASIPAGTYYAKVTYGTSTLMGGWGSLLNIN